MKACGKSKRGGVKLDPKRHYDPTVRADANDERCPDCGASYEAFRSGEDTRAMKGWIWASVAGVEMDPGLHTDRNVDSETKAMSRQIKRTAWAEQHGPGRCVFGLDEYIRDYRANMTGVVVLDDREWRLREIVADLLLADEDRVDEQNIEADDSFDPSSWDAVPVFIDDGNETTYIAA